MGAHYFVMSLFAIAGLLSLLAAFCNWEWFFTAQNTQFVVRHFGRNKARWVYGVLGLIMLGMAAYIFLYTQEQQPTL